LVTNINIKNDDYSSTLDVSRLIVDLAFDGGCKTSETGDSIDRQRDNEADQLNDCDPPRKTRPI